MSSVSVEVAVEGWEENDYDPVEGPVRLAQADYPTRYTGELTGEGRVRILLTYTAGDPSDMASLEADYVGYERITGTLAGRTGAFVLRLAGTHADGHVRATGEIVPDSGTGELAGITGRVGFEIDGMTYSMTLTYELG